MNCAVIFSRRPEIQIFAYTQIKSITGHDPLLYTERADLGNNLRTLSHVDLMVLDLEMVHHPEEIYVYISDHFEGSKTNLYVISDSPINAAKGLVVRSSDIELIATDIRHLVNQESDQTLEESDLVGIPIDLINHFEIYPLDLFIKLSDSKKVKIGVQSGPVDKDQIHAFKNKNVKELFFAKRSNQDFTKLLVRNMIERGKNNQNGNILIKSQVQNEIYNTTKDLINTFGIKQNVLNICNSVISRIVEDSMDPKSFFSNIQSIQKFDTLESHYRFIEISSFLAAHVVAKHGLIMQEEVLTKMITACFLSDITLKENDLFKIRRNADFAKLNAKQKKSVHDHALEASLLISKNPNIPQGVEILIKQHHGSSNGQGLPEEYSAGLNSMSYCLIAAQEVSMEIVYSGDTIENSIAKVNKNFGNGPLGKYLALL